MIRAMIFGLFLSALVVEASFAQPQVLVRQHVVSPQCWCGRPHHVRTGECWCPYYHGRAPVIFPIAQNNEVFWVKGKHEVFSVKRGGGKKVVHQVPQGAASQPAPDFSAPPLMVPPDSQRPQGVVNQPVPDDLSQSAGVVVDPPATGNPNASTGSGMPKPPDAVGVDSLQGNEVVGPVHGTSDGSGALLQLGTDLDDDCGDGDPSDDETEDSLFVDPPVEVKKQCLYAIPFRGLILGPCKEE